MEVQSFNGKKTNQKQFTPFQYGAKSKVMAADKMDTIRVWFPSGA